MEAMKLRRIPNIDENVDHLRVGLELFRQLAVDQVMPVTEKGSRDPNGW
jgi:hypothetical protein